jgi:hypothetical protein
MRLILILSLVIVGVLELPLTFDLKNKQIIGGEVKEEEVEFRNHLFKKITPTPSLVRRPSSTPISTTQLASKPKVSHTANPQTAQEISLLAVKTNLKDKKLEINLPALDFSKNWFLVIEYDLISVEDVLGFDNPGLTIHIDERLAYQQSALESGSRIVSFNPAVFSHQPQILTIWSGNSGDEIKDTHLIIKMIKLVLQGDYDFIETEPINDLIVTVDNEPLFTLEWSSPKTNDSNLRKALAYDIRYSSEPISKENWPQSQSVEVFLPQDFSPQFSKNKEVILIKSPSIDSGYLSIRSLDSTGLLSPLGKNVFFMLTD